MSTSIGKFKVSVSAYMENGKSFGRDVDKGLRGVTMVAGATAVALGGATKVAADFEQQLSNVKAVSGATDKQMQALRETSVRIGQDTAYSSTEAAAAIEELVKAGVSVKDVLNGAADASVNLAAATGITVPESATLMSNAMNQFGLKAEDLVGITDTIAGAANASAIDASQFAYSLSQAGATANLAGLTFDETATAIAQLGQAGIVGSDAGTSLKTMLSRLTPSTDSAYKAMKALGLITKDGKSAFYNAKGELKSFDKVQALLQKGTEKLTASEKQYYLGKIFGSDAIRAAAVLAEAGEKGYNKMNKAMGETTAAEVAKTRQDNLNMTLEQLKGTLETVAISIGTVLIPTLRNLAEWLTKMVDLFNGLPTGAQKTITMVITLTTVVLLLSVGFVKLYTVVKDFILIMKALRAVLAASRLAFILTWIAALGPIAIIIVIIAVLVGLFVLLWKKSETFREAIKYLWAAFKAGLVYIKDFWIKTFKAIWSFMQDTWDAFKAGLTYIKDFWVGVWTSIIDFFKQKWLAFKTGLTAIKNFFINTFNGILNWIKAHWKLILAILTGPVGLAVYFIVKYWDKIKAAVSAALGFIKGVWTATWSAIKTGFQAVVSWISTKISQVVGFFTALKSKITGAVRGAFDGLKTAAITAFNAVAGFWNSTVGSISFTVPDWVPKVGGNGWSFPQIPMLANGGIVDSATLAMIGEAGPEAVIPLDRLSSIVNGIAGESGAGKEKVVNVTQNISTPAPQTNSEVYLAAKRGMKSALQGA